MFVLTVGAKLPCRSVILTSNRPNGSGAPLLAGVIAPKLCKEHAYEPAHSPVHVTCIPGEGAGETLLSIEPCNIIIS